MSPNQTSRENAMKITGNLASHSRVIARSRLSVNYSRAIARPGAAVRGKLAANHSRAIA